MHADLLLLLRQLAPISPSEQDLITKSFKPRSLSKGEYFLKAGKINRYIGYLHSGLVRYFVYREGEESTFEFTREGEFIADYHSFNNHCPSVQNIQAIENCELLVINREAVQKIFDTTTHGDRIGRLIMEHRFNIMVTQLLAIYMQAPSARYQSFMNEYASLAQRIPQYLIASYVGVQPESLSRIRKRGVKGVS